MNAWSYIEKNTGMKISGNTFLVTGGGSGLGRATVRYLVSQSATVVAADVNDSAVNDLADELGAKVVAQAVDVCSESETQAAIETASQQQGPLRGVINCAGVLGAARTAGRNGPFDLGEFERVIRVNLVGTFNVTRLAAQAMSEAPEEEDGERGVIINTSSVAAYDGQIGQAAYSASKGGVAAMTLPIARDLAKLGIRAVAIAPGVFETPMMQAAPEAVRDALQAATPFPSRLGDPEEFARLAAHVIENRMINGAVLRIDGALRMPPR